MKKHRQRYLPKQADAVREQARAAAKSRRASMPEGWSDHSGSLKWHYYTAGRSLCGKWLQQHDDVLADDGQLRPRDCHECRRHLQQKGGAA